MIFVGIDIAKMNHVACAVDETGDKLTQPLPFKNNEVGLEKFIAWLEGLAEDQSDIYIAMEATGHYWMACFSYLTARDYAACVINPLQVKAMRNLKKLPKVKNDSIDSWLIAETLRLDGAVDTRLASDDLHSLKVLSRYHQSLKQEAATVKTQVICVLDSYFPEYASQFSDVFGAASMALLKKYPLPCDIAQARVSSIGKELSRASRGRIGIDRASELKSSARASIGITLGQDAAAFQIKEMIAQIEYLDKQASKVESKVEALLMELEPLITTIPGISVTTGAQIVSEIGDVARFKNAAAIVKYAGLNSGVSQSGQFQAKGEPITKIGSPYLRRALWLAANTARRFDPKMREYYEKLRSEKKCHRVAVTACARKLCHIVYAIMRDKVAYDPTR